MVIKKKFSFVKSGGTMPPWPPAGAGPVLTLSPSENLMILIFQVNSHLQNDCPKNLKDCKYSIIGCPFKVSQSTVFCIG